MAYLFGAPVRTGKTTTAVREADALLTRNPRAKVVFIAPSWGEFGDKDSGVGETVVRYFAENHRRKCSVAAGRWRTCTDWRDACEGGTPSPRDYHALKVRLCDPCKREKSHDLIAMSLAEGDAPVSAPEFPQASVCGANVCPAALGLVAMYLAKPGSIWVTTPTTFRRAVAEAETKGRLRDWMRDLVIFVDEAHKDRFFLETQSPVGFLCEPQGALPLPGFLKALPPELAARKPAPACQADPLFGEIQADEWETFRRVFQGDVRQRALIARRVFDELTTTQDARGFIESLERMARRGESARAIATKITNLLQSEWPDEIEWARLRLLSLAPGLYEVGGERLPKDWSPYFEGDWELLRIAWTEFDTTRAFASAVTSEGLHDPLTLPYDQWKCHIASKMLEALASIPKLSEEAEAWANALVVYLAAMGNVLWVEYREEPTGLWMDLVGLDAVVNVAAHETGEPLIQPRYGPFVEALDAGASVVLLTGTPGIASDARRFFQNRPVKRIPYADDEPRPRLRIVVELAHRGIGGSIEGEPARFREQSKVLLTGILARLNGRAHVVARTKREHAASAALGLPEHMRHYFRDRASLGVAWRTALADDGSWDAGLPIVALGPPFLRPTVWGSFTGLVHNDKGETHTVAASRAYQREKMAQEFFQTAARTAKVRNGFLVGRVILLGGAEALPILKEYAEKWQIEVEWVEIRPTGKLKERAERLAAAVQGAPALPSAALRIVVEWGDMPFSRSSLLKRWGGNGAKWRSAIDSLLTAGWAVPSHKDGKEQCYSLRNREGALT